MTEYINPEFETRSEAANVSAVAILGFADMSLAPDDDIKPPHRPDISEEELGKMIHDAFERLYGPIEEPDPAEREKFLKSLRERTKSD